MEVEKKTGKVLILFMQFAHADRLRDQERNQVSGYIGCAATACSTVELFDKQ